MPILECYTQLSVTCLFERYCSLCCSSAVCLWAAATSSDHHWWCLVAIAGSASLHFAGQLAGSVRVYTASAYSSFTLHQPTSTPDNTSFNVVVCLPCVLPLTPPVRCQCMGAVWQPLCHAVPGHALLQEAVCQHRRRQDSMAQLCGQRAPATGIQLILQPWCLHKQHTCLHAESWMV